VKGILTVGTDRQATPATAAGDGGAAAHLRGPAGLSLVPDPDGDADAEFGPQEVAS